MKDYKNTLFMPKTPFEMRGNLGQREPLFQKKWNDLDLYNKVILKNADKKEFNLHDGPPYANGEIHVGHALNKTLKDFVVRYKNMNGFKARYIPGWDTHGLPIENALTKSGVNRKEVSPVTFRKLCAEYAYKQVERQMNGFKRLGVLGEYDNPYITLQKDFEADQVRVFAKMVERGLIYKGLKPVYWSPSSESALAEAEIEYHDKEDSSIYFTFKLTNGEGLFEDALLTVWTTTPWTIPADLAVCVGPEIEYALVSVGDKKYICAYDLLAKLSELLGWENPEVLQTVTGLELSKYTYVHCLYPDRICPIIYGDHVTTTDGTGLVHTAPGHGEDDYLVGKKFGLEVFCPVDNKGVMMASSGKYQGLFYQSCNEEVIKDMEACGSLLKLVKIVHSYPHDWRTKKPVIFRATPQWFASIDPIKEEILEAIKGIEWTPKWGEIRISNMIADRHDWCISRQRAWGVPIPVFYAEDGTAILDQKVLAHVADLFALYGSDVWVERNAKDLLPEGYTHPGSPNGLFTKENDIMDVWFDSGSSYMLLKRRGLQYPADLYLEGSDQYRGWFNSSIITGIATTGTSPYKENVTHGFVLDGEGRKMSKSLGNTVDPNKVFSQMGADIFRLWVASVEYNVDVRISDEMLKQVAETYRKIRNTLRFLLANTSDFNPDTDRIALKDMPEVDQYMLVKLQKLINNVKDAYDHYSFQDVYRGVMNFITNTLSAFYLDFTKDILYIEEKKGLSRLSVQTVLYDVLMSLLKLLSPILPHTTTEAYDFVTGKKCDDIYLEEMPVEQELSGDQLQLEANWDNFMKYRDLVLKALEDARNAKVIGKSFNAHLTLQLDDEAKKVFDAISGNIRQILIVSDLTVTEGSEFVATVVPAEGETCSRCWQIVPSINEDELCPRCAKIVKELSNE